MSERIDHAAEAWEVWRDGIARGHPDARDNPAHESLLHMVNALVEQQRIANLIAVMAMARQGVGAGEHSKDEYVRLHQKINPQVMEGLGL